MYVKKAAETTYVRKRRVHLTLMKLTPEISLQILFSISLFPIVFIRFLWVVSEMPNVEYLRDGDEN